MDRAALKPRAIPSFIFIFLRSTASITFRPRQHIAWKWKAPSSLMALWKGSANSSLSRLISFLFSELLLRWEKLGGRARVWNFGHTTREGRRKHNGALGNSEFEARVYCVSSVPHRHKPLGQRARLAHYVRCNSMCATKRARTVAGQYTNSADNKCAQKNLKIQLRLHLFHHKEIMKRRVSNRNYVACAKEIITKNSKWLIFENTNFVNCKQRCLMSQKRHSSHKQGWTSCIRLSIL